MRDASGEVHKAELLGADPSSGLAALQVRGLAAAPLEPADSEATGQFVLSLGRTWSGALAVSAGVVSVVGGPLRTGRGPALERVLRADVRLHPLGAGGPLVSAGGRALAIATGARLRGLPLFIPASIAWQIAQTVQAHGRTKRGYLGLGGQSIQLPEKQRAGRPQDRGVLVIGVAADSPAEQGGILVGDVVVGFEGHPIEDHDDLLALLTGDRIGKPAKVDVSRGGMLETLSVVVGER